MFSFISMKEMKMAQHLKGCASPAKDPGSALSTSTVRSQHDFSFMSMAQTHILT